VLKKEEIMTEICEKVKGEYLKEDIVDEIKN